MSRDITTWARRDQSGLREPRHFVSTKPRPVQFVMLLMCRLITLVEVMGLCLNPLWAADLG